MTIKTEDQEPTPGDGAPLPLERRESSHGALSLPPSGPPRDQLIAFMRLPADVRTALMEMPELADYDVILKMLGGWRGVVKMAKKARGRDRRLMLDFRANGPKIRDFIPMISFDGCDPSS